MAATEFEGMVVVDGVRWRLDDLKRLKPEAVKDAVPADIATAPEVYQRVSTAPGAVVTGEDALGGTLISTEDSAAGNVPVPDTKHEDGADVSGESGRSGAGNKETAERPARRGGASKSK